jgi:hypothetical protein
MPTRAVRPEADRTADRTKIANLASSMRQDVTDLNGAIAALPAPASRNAAQKRDALIMRCLIRLIRWCLITSGAGTAADRGPEPA